MKTDSRFLVATLTIPIILVALGHSAHAASVVSGQVSVNASASTMPGTGDVHSGSANATVAERSVVAHSEFILPASPPLPQLTGRSDSAAESVLRAYSSSGLLHIAVDTYAQRSFGGAAFTSASGGASASSGAAY